MLWINESSNVVDFWLNCPVLKHGPRSLLLVQVFSVYTEKPNESDSVLSDQKFLSFRWSTYKRTRKMVNYSCATWNQRKLWWRREAILTCKSFVWNGYRGERLIEPSSSWFLLKFPSGLKRTRTRGESSESYTPPPPESPSVLEFVNMQQKTTGARVC